METTPLYMYVHVYTFLLKYTLFNGTFLWYNVPPVQPNNSYLHESVSGFQSPVLVCRAIGINALYVDPTEVGVTASHNAEAQRLAALEDNDLWFFARNYGWTREEG